MGVSGCGKTTVGEIVASRLGWPFAEGDEMHPAENVAKMSAGTPLTDDDRWPWLRIIGKWMDEHPNGVVTCSALKRAYRDLLREGRPQVRFAHLDGSKEQIAERLSDRKGHFMPASLLDSQFADLEPLGTDEPGVRINIAGTPESLAQQVISAFR